MKQYQKWLMSLLIGGGMALSFSASADEEAELDPAYLAGEWCYSHYMAGPDRKDKNINYIFNEDGTLLYQNNSRTKVNRQGSYTINDGIVKILPTHMAFTFRPQSVTQNELVLSGLGVHHFVRGTCG